MDQESILSFFIFLEKFLIFQAISYKNSTRISCIPFTQIHQLFTFFSLNLLYHCIVYYICVHFFPEPFELSWTHWALLLLNMLLCMQKNKEIHLNNHITMIKIRKIEP